MVCYDSITCSTGDAIHHSAVTPQTLSGTVEYAVLLSGVGGDDDGLPEGAVADSSLYCPCAGCAWASAQTMLSNPVLSRR